MVVNFRDPPVTERALKSALKGMILSPSGWRGVFAASGNEEDPSAALAPPYGIIAAVGALVFAEYLAARSGGKPALILGRDTRPTGEAAADIMIRAFLASGCAVRFAGIAAAPEIMAFAGSSAGGASGSKPAGFCYISASHNPVGHNGLKFGLDDGGVLEGKEANKLIDALKTCLARPDPIAGILALLEKARGPEVERVYAESEQVKREALEAYLSFSRELAAGPPPAGNRVMEAVAKGLKQFPLGIAADFNGSARTVSIDRELFRSLGIGFHAINDKPGEIAHTIIPEGKSLEQCRLFLEEQHAADPSVILGYVPDCDGDRGNLVIWDDALNAGRSLEAQEVFALACAAELAHLAWAGDLACPGKPAWPGKPEAGVKEGRPPAKAAIAVNGPTSMRIDRIAEAFGVRVFRSEVGEANVVNLARRLRNEGYLVRILGEGSNGGNITHPSSVRDPLATILALVKFLTIRGGSAGGFFDIWRGLSAVRGAPGAPERVNPAAGTAFTMSDIIASLPVFYTTGVATPEAKFRVRTADHALLKEKYQAVFEREWAAKKEDLQRRWGIAAWEGRACIGTEELRNLVRFGLAGTGGLKIVFKDSGGRELAFIWMRGSRTEPVFRIMADAEGSAELERELIAWQGAMTAAADGAAARAEAGAAE
ncbi:MAG: phosphatidylglycerol lysyltransferase [Treponema sp.]|jgi:phosphoglucomutase|nr:phosphatidylglycerol lysyltransferase [Treponema sp.]